MPFGNVKFIQKRKVFDIGEIQTSMWRPTKYWYRSAKAWAIARLNFDYVYSRGLSSLTSLLLRQASKAIFLTR